MKAAGLPELSSSKDIQYLKVSIAQTVNIYYPWDGGYLQFL